MVELIDGEGRVLGPVNVVDLLVVLLVLAVVAAGVALVTGTDRTTGTDTTATTNTTPVHLRVEGVQPYVAEAIPEGRVGGGDVKRVREKTVEAATVVTKDADGNLHLREHPVLKDVTLRVTLVTTGSEEPMFGGTPVEVGRKLTLDLGEVTVTGRVTGVGSA